jgi:hypothetical protein
MREKWKIRRGWLKVHAMIDVKLIFRTLSCSNTNNF